MSEQNSELLARLMSLSELDRAWIAERLLTSLGTGAEDLTSEELERQLDERVADFHQNPADAIPWTQLRDE